MIEIIIPVYDQEHFYALESLYTIPFDANVKVTIVDDSKDQNIKYDHKRAALGSVTFSIIRNKSNKGTLISRLQAAYQSKGDYVYFLDADDYLDYNALLVAVASMSPIISMMTTSCYMCKGDSMSIFYSQDYDQMRKTYKVERVTKIVGSLWRGSDLRKCVFDLLNAHQLYKELTQICNSNKIVLQEDEFLWMWCKCWMYNNKKSYCYSWIPTFYYNQYEENKVSKDYKPLDVDSNIYKERHDKWYQLLRDAWKF